MIGNSKQRTVTNDWQITSYGDVGAFAGVGVRISHHKFHSPKLGISAQTAFLQVGLGAGVDFKFPEFE